MIDPASVAAAVGCPAYRAEKWAAPLAAAMDRFGIVAHEDRAAFLAQTGFESGRFAYVREIWGPTKWQLKYEGHTGLGNTEPGDGRRFCGRGLIQVTGRSNYSRCGLALGLDLLARPELLEDPLNAALSAGWFWKANGLSDLAKAGEFDKITRRINGSGMLGADERRAMFEKAKAAI